MKLTCSFCGIPVSTEINEDVICNCWIECPECIQKEYNEIPESKRLIVKKFKEAENEPKMPILREGDKLW